MSLNEEMVRDPRKAFQAVDVLGEELVEEAFLGQETDELVGDGRLVFPRVDLLGQCVEWPGVLLEEIYVKYIGGVI